MVEMSYEYIPIDTNTDSLSKKKDSLFKRIIKFTLLYKKLIISLILAFLLITISLICYIQKNYYTCEEPIITDEFYSKIKGEPNIDKFGIDLNQFIEKEIFSQKIPGKDTLDNWNLYTPVCPNLEPIHYSEELLNPNCEDLSLQIVNFENELGRGKPYSLHLHSITNQIKNWNKWSRDKDKFIPNYRKKNVKELISDSYHPFDYGYYDENEIELKNDNDTISYYKKVINSRMDETPDPRHRRLFSFILFNTEFDLLDIYLSEYYELFDYFVIYESNATFSGTVKPLLFTRMLLETDRYDKFKDKIITFPLPMESVCTFYRSPFTKEHLARRQLIEMGLRAVQARHGDLIMHGDLDEMPKPHIITRIKKCGGWEHLQAGIGGGPISTREKKVNSYLQDENLNKKLERDKYGFPRLVYDRELSVGFLNWFYEYSFEIVEDKSIGTKATPNIAIFDARRALGQYPKHYKYVESEGDGNIMESDKYSKWNKRNPIEESYVDPLTQPDFDPYKGYSYTQNENDNKDGQGFLGEYMRFTTARDIDDFYGKQDVLFWSGGWHMSTFLPTIEHFLNKVLSYSHFDMYKFMSDEKRRKKMIGHIKNRTYIFGKNKYYDNNTIFYPESPETGYKYNFSYKTWLSYENNNNKYEKVKDMLYHEIPEVVLKNPICYSYMIDREFGLEKKLWWQVIPKEQWKTVDFEKLNKDTLDKITPSNIPENFKPKALKKEK